MFVSVFKITLDLTQSLAHWTVGHSISVIWGAPSLSSTSVRGGGASHVLRPSRSDAFLGQVEGSASLTVLTATPSRPRLHSGLGAPPSPPFLLSGLKATALYPSL